jgi:hypothetical protein
LRHSGQFLPFDELVHVNFERALQAAPRAEECAISLMSNSNSAKGLSSKLKISPDVVEGDAKCGGNAIAASVRALKEASVPPSFWAWAIDWLHGFPILGGKLQVNIPDLLGFENFVGFQG